VNFLFSISIPYLRLEAVRHWNIRLSPVMWRQMFLLVEADRLHLFKKLFVTDSFLGSIKLHFKGSIAVIFSNRVTH
jgi:hypothetical protein